MSKVRLLLAIVCFLVAASVAKAEMVLNSTVGNDPEKEKLCAARAKATMVPFEIDFRYVASVRSLYPDATFIAVDERVGPRS